MRILHLAALGLLLLSIQASADVAIPGFFTPGMVFQQNAKIPVWGVADPGELVQVSLGDKQIRTKADAKGAWRVEFPPMPATDKPMTLAIGGRNGIQLDGVLVGEVWVVAGTGNMQFHIADEPNRGQDIVAQAKDPLLHIFGSDPRAGIRPKTTILGGWHDPSSPWFPNDSAIGYFFGEQLRQKLNVPIGIITAAQGPTIETFLSKEALAKIPGYEKQLADIAAREAVFPKDAAGQKAAMDDWGKRLHDWDQNQNHPWIDAEVAWGKARDAAIAAKQPVPPEPPRRPDPPRNPDGEVGDVTTNFNAMIAPWIGFPIHGVAWYAGEQNDASGQAGYEVLQRALIDDWRARWKSPFSFLIIGLAGNGPRNTAPENSGLAEVRGAQIAVAASEPNAGLAQALDLGLDNSPWPPDKQDVGKRLAATALHVAYGQNVPFDGPRFGGMTVEGNKIRVTYANPEGGLVLADAPATANDPHNQPVPLSEPLGFEVAGADKKWVNAKAQIDGGTMLVWSDTVPNPVAVRYAWASNPPVNLYSKDGFPAVPFRTQDWKVNP
jgi:sialate O-acetylesterase